MTATTIPRMKPNRGVQKLNKSTPLQIWPVKRGAKYAVYCILCKMQKAPGWLYIITNVDSALPPLVHKGTQMEDEDIIIISAAITACVDTIHLLWKRKKRQTYKMAIQPKYHLQALLHPLFPGACDDEDSRPVCVNVCVYCGECGGIWGSGGKDTHGRGDIGGRGGDVESDLYVSGREGVVGTEDVVMVAIRPSQCFQGRTESE